MYKFGVHSRHVIRCFLLHYAVFCLANVNVNTLPHTLYPGCNIFVYIAEQKQPNTTRARMDCGKLTLFLLLQTLKRGVASQDFAEKHSVPTFMFRHK